MKPRTPKSFAAAITKIMTALTDEKCGRIVGRSASLIRKWADPDHAGLPALHQAVALDIVYAREGHGAPPILAVYEEYLQAGVNDDESEEVDILMSALAVQGVVGDLSEAIREALTPAGAGGTSITARERQTILQIIDKLDDQTNLIENAVEDEEKFFDSLPRNV